VTVFQIRGFVRSDKCEYVTAAYERCRAEQGANVGNPFFDYRVLWINSFPDHENETRRILQNWRRRAVKILSAKAGRPLYSDTIQVVRWGGQKMPPHQDDRHPDGSPHNTPWREWASIIYLNDNYEGGEIYFPDIGVTHKPAVGTLLFFEGALRHGVHAARGYRYTSPSWYTSDPRHEDPWAKTDF
jgi:predicted 2-oxoglutarate/Fe(II)-dependent dioxygenase YbiX